MSKPRPAVFLDRDGTIIEEVGYPSRAEQVRLLPGAAAAIARLRQAGFACVVVTNQSGVGRGILTLEQMHAVNEEMVRQLREAGTELDGLYYCTEAPHCADQTIIEHPDRKPGPGMLLRAAREMNLDLPKSWAVGDKVSDILAGRNAGCRGGILVKTGHPLAQVELAMILANDLTEAVVRILSSAIN